MSSERTSGSWREPTWRRLVGSTVVLFLVILAFLVGRVRAGADPGLAGRTTPVTQSAPPATQQQQQQPSVDPNSGGGSTDNFGNAVPDQSGGTQGFDPPSTHVS